MKHTPRQQDKPQEQGNIMQHTSCSPGSKTSHKNKETENAAQVLQPRQQDTPREEGSRT
jgi:hypothetical protein